MINNYTYIEDRVYFKGTAYFNGKLVPSEEIEKYNSGNNCWRVSDDGLLRTEEWIEGKLEIKVSHIVFEDCKTHYFISPLDNIKQRNTIRELEQKYMPGYQQIQAWKFEGQGFFNGQKVYDFIEFKEEGLFETPTEEYFLIERDYSSPAFLWKMTPLKTDLELLQARSKYCK